jgi:hypothetical protein
LIFIADIGIEMMELTKHRYGPAPTFKSAFSLTKWAEDPANAQAWKSIMASSAGQVTQDPFTDVEANFTFGDAGLVTAISLSMVRFREYSFSSLARFRKRKERSLLQRVVF